MYTASYPLRAQAAIELRKRREANATPRSAYRVFQARYRDDPAGFAADCVNWPNDGGLSSYQAEILSALPDRRRVSARGPHGLGKSALAAIAILWFALTRDGEDWKIPTTASAWRQLTKFLWPEVHKWARRLRWDVIGREPFNERLELLSLSVKLSTGEAFALASDNPAMIEGAHAAHLLYVFDESKVIPAPTWESAEGAFSTGEAYWLAISTPGEPNGTFYDIQRRAPGYEDWWARRVTLAEAIQAGRISADWAEQRRRQWGEGSAAYQNRVLGEFATQAEDGVIPLAWIEAANTRWEEWNDAGRPGAFTCVGADVGRGGDKSSQALRFDNAIGELRRDTQADTMVLAGRVRGVLDRYRGDGRPYAVVDVIGIGAGVVDYLRQEGYNVIAFNASEKTERKDKTGELGFVNMRAFGWWNMRELLDPANGHNIALPPDDLLTGDLTAPKWRVMAGGKIQVESKDDIRKRLGRSTDDGDAVVMAFAEVRPAALPAAQPTQRSRWTEPSDYNGGSRWRV